MARTTVELSVKFSWWVKPVMAALTFIAPVIGWAISDRQVEQVCSWLAKNVVVRGMKVSAYGE